MNANSTVRKTRGSPSWGMTASSTLSVRLTMVETTRKSIVPRPKTRATAGSRCHNAQANCT